MTNKTFKSNDIDSTTIDHALSVADFGDREFVSNDGAYYEGNAYVDCVCYFVALDENGEPELDAESESASLVLKFEADSGWTVSCEHITNAEEVEKALNEITNTIEVTETEDLVPNTPVDKPVGITIGYIANLNGAIHSVNSYTFSSNRETRERQAIKFIESFIDLGVSKLYMFFGDGTYLSSKPTAADLDYDVRWIMSRAED